MVSQRWQATAKEAGATEHEHRIVAQRGLGGTHSQPLAASPGDSTPEAPRTQPDRIPPRSRRYRWAAPRRQTLRRHRNRRRPTIAWSLRRPACSNGKAPKDKALTLGRSSLEIASATAQVSMGAHPRGTHSLGFRGQPLSESQALRRLRMRRCRYRVRSENVHTVVPKLCLVHSRHVHFDVAALG